MLTLPVLCIHSITKCSREDGASLTGDPAGGRPASSRRYRHPNRLGIDGRLMGDVIFVAEEKLERMLSEWKVDLCLVLAGAKMQVCEVARNWLIQRRQLGIDQQMVMSGILPIGARRCHSHTAKPNMNDRFGRQRIAVLD